MKPVFLSVLGVALLAWMGVAGAALTPTATPTKAPTGTPTRTRTPTPTPTRTPTPTATAPAITLSGSAIQGAMAYTTVLAYAVNSNGSDGSFLGGTLADVNGNFTVHLPPRPPGPVRLTATGGYFISEMNSETVSLPSNISALVASPVTNISAISINPLADFENSITVKRLKAGATFTNAYGRRVLFHKALLWPGY